MKSFKFHFLEGRMKVVSVGIDIVWAVNSVGGALTRDGKPESSLTDYRTVEIGTCLHTLQNFPYSYNTNKKK